MHQAIGHYYKQVRTRSARLYTAPHESSPQKLAADRDLSKRTSFSWTILKPGALLDEPGTGKVSLGRTHLSPGVPVRLFSLSLR